MSRISAVIRRNLPCPRQILAARLNLFQTEAAIACIGENSLETFVDFKVVLSK